ncbi:MAG: Rep family protein [Eubacteriales bacterium]|nr:Rep family protein [Eubacteriales bacterium]
MTTKEKKPVQNDEKYRSRLFNILLYPDDPSQQYAIEMLKTSQYNVAGILHDKDSVQSTGEQKKAHYHFVVQFRNAIWNTALAAQLKIQPNYMRETRNFDNSLAYLLHQGTESKYQYSIDECFGTLVTRLKKVISDATTTDDERVCDILDLLDSEKHYIGYSEFIRMCAKAGRYSDLRRGGYLLAQVLNEHNEIYGGRKYDGRTSVAASTSCASTD